MKKLILIAILVFGLLFFVACGTEEGQADEEMGNGEEETDEMYADGVYTGTGEGYNGEIVVNVTIEGGEITNVIVEEHQETEDISGPAFEALTTQVIANQGTDGVDVETGATGSSEGFLEAVDNALEEAQ